MGAISFLNKIETRNYETDGVKEWAWVKSDSGGFGTDNSGPRNDWLKSHKQNYFDIIKKYDTIITAGACCGMYVRFYAEKFKTVYAFEPDSKNFHCMVMNNPFDNVIKINAALGKEHKMIKMTESPTNVGAISIDGEGIIPMLLIDDFEFEHCDVIQLDVEHYEKDVLTGAKNTIEKFKPVIILEHFTDNSYMKQHFGYKFVKQSAMDFIFVPEE